MSTDIELSDYVAINKAEVNLREEELGKLIGCWKSAGWKMETMYFVVWKKYELTKTSLYGT